MIADFVAAIPRAWGEFAATLLLAYLAVDTTITVLHILRFNEKLASLSEAHDALQKKLEGTRLYASRQEIITRFESMPAAEFLREFKERMAEERKGWSSCARRNVCVGSWFRRKTRKNWNPVSMLCRRVALSSAV